MYTFSYKHGYIHENFTTGVVKVQIGPNVYRVASVRAAKLFITKNKGV
jgi:hypothetical protein